MQTAYSLTSHQLLFNALRFHICLIFIILGTTAFSQKVVDEQMSNCDPKEPADYIKNRLIYKKLSGDTTILRIGLVLNCHFSPKFHFNQSNDTLYFNVKNTSDIFAACDCCFEFEIKLTEIQDSNFTLVYNYLDSRFTKKEGFYDVEVNEVLNLDFNKYIFPSLLEINDTSKLNQTDENGNKTGLWHKYNEETGLIETKIFYESDNPGKAKWFVSYTEDEEINEVCSTVLENGKRYSNCIDRDEYFDLISITPVED